MTPNKQHDDDLLKLAEGDIEPEDCLPQAGASLAQPVDLDEEDTQEIDIDALFADYTELDA